jgi:hypothetical protein
MSSANVHAAVETGNLETVRVCFCISFSKLFWLSDYIFFFFFFC